MTCYNFERYSPLLTRALSRGAQSGAIGVPTLLAAVAVGRIALTIITGRRDVWTPRNLKTSLPAIVLVSDDNGDARNADEWRAAISAIAWARTAIVHGAAARAEHYRGAISAAEIAGRLLLVETDFARAPSWVDALAPRRVPCLAIIPPPGCAHPVAAPTSAGARCPV